MDNARHAVNVATSLCLLRVAYGRHKTSRRRGGTFGIYLELRRLLCRNFPRRYTGNSTRSIRGGEGSRLETLADDALHNFSASPARRIAADIQ